MISSSPPSLIARAAALSAASKTILPIALAASASAASLNFDFFGAGLFDDSGFFASTVTPADGGGLTQGTGFKLYGTQTIDDSIFYQYSEREGKTVPRSDGDGLGLIWGGAVNGSFQAGDMLTAPFEFSYHFTHTPGNVNDIYVSNPWVLTVGLLNAYDPTNFTWSEPFGTASIVASSEVNGYEDAAGSYDRSGTISLTIEEWMVEYETPTHWFVQLAVMVSHENDSWNWDGPFTKQNGDTLTVTVPQNSIDLALIPEPSTAALFGFAGLSVLRRRRQAR